MRHNGVRAAELGALGKELACIRLFGDGSEPALRLRVVDRLMRLHGIPQKIGQTLSLTELNDDSPIFTRLVETPSQLPTRAAIAEIERALGRPWRDCFRSLDEHGIGASLAQVHRGTLPDGRAVAVKIQYPKIAEALDLDLGALGWLTAPLGGLRKGFDFAGYRREVGTMLRQELDYEHEANMLKRFRSFAGGFDGVEIPEVIEELSSTRVLTMTWVNGWSFSDTRRWPLQDRKYIADTLLLLFFSSLFSERLLHADPHPGNYRFLRGWGGVKVGLLDFGCVKTLSTDTTNALHGLIDDTLERRLTGNPERARARLEMLGFNPAMLAPMQHLLPALCDILFCPLLKDEAFDSRNWRLGDRVDSLLGEFRWNFRMAGPPALIYFVRAYQGLIQYLAALDAPANWRAAYERAGHVPTSEPLPTALASGSAAAASRLLRVRVIRSGQMRADLSLPAAAAENLLDIMPREVGLKLAARNIDISHISREVAEAGFPPGDLFALREGQDDLRVWLE